MVGCGCMLVATELSSKHNMRLMAQYEWLEEKLKHWTKCVFLITETLTSIDGKRQSIVGVSLTNEEEEDASTSTQQQRTEELKKLGLPTNTRSFIGGPVSPNEPFVVFSARTSKLPTTTSPPKYCEKVLAGGQEEDDDLSLWFISTRKSIPKAIQWARTNNADAIDEIRVYWGCAVWGRVQLLGEIARGGWGLSKGRVTTWCGPITNCWQTTLKNAVFAGSNDMSIRFNRSDD